MDRENEEHDYKPKCMYINVDDLPELNVFLRFRKMISVTTGVHTFLLIVDII